MDPDPAALVARVVRGAMTERGIADERLAHTTGIPLPTLRHRLAGRSPFTIAELETVAAVLGTSASALLQRGLR